MLAYEYEILPMLAVYIVTGLLLVTFAAWFYRHGRRRRPNASRPQLLLVAVVVGFFLAAVIGGLLMPLDWILARLF